MIKFLFKNIYFVIFLASVPTKNYFEQLKYPVFWLFSKTSTLDLSTSKSKFFQIRKNLQIPYKKSSKNRNFRILGQKLCLWRTNGNIFGTSCIPEQFQTFMVLKRL